MLAAYCIGYASLLPTQIALRGFVLIRLGIFLSSGRRPLRGKRRVLLYLAQIAENISVAVVVFCLKMHPCWAISNNACNRHTNGSQACQGVLLFAWSCSMRILRRVCFSCIDSDADSRHVPQQDFVKLDAKHFAYLVNFHTHKKKEEAIMLIV